MLMILISNRSFSNILVIIKKAGFIKAGFFIVITEHQAHEIRNTDTSAVKNLYLHAYCPLAIDPN